MDRIVILFIACKQLGTLLFSDIDIVQDLFELIIELLARNRSRIISYDMFRDYVYNDYEIDTGTIRAEVNRLKKVLKEDIVVNIRGVGYMIERPRFYYAYGSLTHSWVR